MEKKKPDEKKLGRPKASETPKMEVVLDGEYVLVRIPRKDLTKKLLGELLG